jgi:thymidylate synthase
MNNIEHQYLKLLKDILDNGVEKQDRTGTGTISVFGRQIRHDMKLGFPLLTTKKMYWKGIVTELLWFLRGDTNIKYLIDNDCHIWDGDAYKKYTNQAPYDVKFGDKENTYRQLSKEEFIDKIRTDDDFTTKCGELGPIYGKQWRDWGGHIIKWQQQNHYGGSFGGPTHVEYGDIIKTYVRGIDQIQNLINDLKTNPDSRRLMVNAWNVGELDSMTLPPCHYGFQVYTRELTIYERANIARVSTKNKQYGFEVEDHWIEGESDFEIKRVLNNLNIPIRAISLMWNQRSCDVPLGIPFNIASYALLLEIIAKEVNMVPDELIGNLGDCHIYKNQIDGVKEQLTRESYQLPNLNFSWYIDNWNTSEAKEARKDSFDAYIRQMKSTDFTLENYQSHPTIKMPLSN